MRWENVSSKSRWVDLRNKIWSSVYQALDEYTHHQKNLLNADADAYPESAPTGKHMEYWKEHH